MVQALALSNSLKRHYLLNAEDKEVEEEEGDECCSYQLYLGGNKLTCLPFSVRN